MAISHFLQCGINFYRQCRGDSRLELVITSPNSREGPKSIPHTKKKLSSQIAETVLRYSFSCHIGIREENIYNFITETTAQV